MARELTFKNYNDFERWASEYDRNLVYDVAKSKDADIYSGDMSGYLHDDDGRLVEILLDDYDTLLEEGWLGAMEDSTPYVSDKEGAREKVIERATYITITNS